jgi:hypothetical protein
VAYLNTRFNLTYSALMAISVGCILGIPNLAGLSNPSMAAIGIPDPA